VRSPRTIVASGYLRAELDGRVHEVRYSQRGLTTTIVMDRVDSLSFAAPVFFHLVRFWFS